MSWKQAGMPDPLKEYSINFPKLDGGLNTWEQDYRLNANESPEMVNLWWKDGALCSRDGQVYASNQQLGMGWSAFEGLYYDHAFFHIGSRIYCADLADADIQQGELTLTELSDGVPENRGTWFQYGGKLYYKNRGGYFAVSFLKGAFSCAGVEAYTPIIRINTDPVTAVGNEFEGQNRLSGQQTVWYSTVPGVKQYQLPVQNVDSVDKVIVDEVELAEKSGYTVDLSAGTITFSAEPTHHEPVKVNTVRITYTKQNMDAYNSIMDCDCAAVYGRDQNICVVLGGCTGQPNAYFWCGDHTEMDPGYFPVEQYNLAGDAQDAITGFGKQQNMLVIFKKRSIGRTVLTIKKAENGRVLRFMEYTAINAAIGCDLPGSIQLVENNLVFSNTRNGVCIVRDSSAANENNITPISRKVDNGLIPILQKAKTVCSHDDGERYWIAADGAVYVWDYALSKYSDPVWFYFTNVCAAAFLTANQTMLHLDNAGRITVMGQNHRDYGDPIRKKYRFAAQYMGSYDRLKDISGVIFTVRGDTDTLIHITYETDYEKRADLTPVYYTNGRFDPCDPAGEGRKFAAVARRKPGCRHVRHFTMVLENNEPGADMAIISAQVFYRYQGRDR